MKTVGIWLLKYIPSLALGFVLCVYTYGAWYKKSANKLEGELKEIQHKIDTNTIIQDIKIEYVDKIKEVEKVVYKTKTEYIDRFIYDTNKTDSDNGMSVIRSIF